MAAASDDQSGEKRRKLCVIKKEREEKKVSLATDKEAVETHYFDGFGGYFKGYRW